MVLVSCGLLFSISVIIKRMFVSVDVFVIRSFIFLAIPCTVVAIAGSCPLQFMSSSGISLSAVEPNKSCAALSESKATIELFSSVSVALSLNLGFCIVNVGIKSMIWLNIC